MIAATTRSIHPSRESAMHQGCSVFGLNSHSLSKLRTLLSVFNHASFIFINLQTLYAKYIRRGTFQQFNVLLTCSGTSLYIQFLFSGYLQCSQQNTNSYKLFSTPILCFHHFMNSLRKKHPGWGGRGTKMPPPNAAPKKMRTSSNAAYALFAADGGLHHAATPPDHRSGRWLRRLERCPKT